MEYSDQERVVREKRNRIKTAMKGFKVTSYSVDVVVQLYLY